MITKLQTVF